MVWSTKYLGRDREYTVIRHKLGGFEGMLEGVRFRSGYGVVDKKSKIYKRLKSLPFLKNGLEFPLVHLRGLKFIQRDRDVETVYGKDVYVHYLKAVDEYETKKLVEERQKEQQKHLEEQTLCKYKRETGELCKHEVHELSPGGHCSRHLLQDPMLEVLDINVPSRLSRDEKQQWKDKVIKKLTQLKSEGAF